MPVIVLHCGPDFDHSYLRPDLDRLADSLRLIYYDQRGRGRSAVGVRAEEVTLKSEIADLEAVRQHYQLGVAAVLGHSWGAVLALEYAIRHSNRVSHLLLMNPAPASTTDLTFFREHRLEKTAPDRERMEVIAATAGYQEGDPDIIAAYYRIHFTAAIRKAEHLDEVVRRLRASLTREGYVKARAIEGRLMQQTWALNGYDRLPKLAQLRIPTLVVHGAHDIIPVEVSEHIAGAVPDSRLVMLKDCGHFSYLECPDAVRTAVGDFLSPSTAPRR